MATHALASMTRAALVRRLRGVYVILNDGARALELAHAALDAGVQILQYRAKHGLDAERVRALRDLTRRRDALLIFNDDWRAAREFACDGVHLGPGDDGFADIAPVRASGADLLIGLSCGTLEELAFAQRCGADYAGVGPVFATASKDDAGEPLGVEGLRRLARATPLPVAAIGGISAENLYDVRETGVAMAALISAIEAAGDPAAVARELVARWTKGAR